MLSGKSILRVSLHWSKEVAPTLQQCTELGNACVRKYAHTALLPGLEALFLLVTLRSTNSKG